MKRTLSLFAAASLMACNNGAPKTGAQPAPEALKQATATNWKGELPCADCEGIAYLLQLQPNDTFYERSIYLGKPGDAFVDKGTWEMSSDSLVTLHNVAGETKFLAFRGEKLELLDKDAKPITSSLAAKYKLERTTLSNVQTPNTVDFTASGNEPFWSLEIDFDKSMHFKNVDGAEIVTPASQGERAADAPVTRYHAETEQGSLTVQLFRQTCENDMSGEQSAYSVTVDVKFKGDTDYKQYTGCGHFLGAYRLNTLWALEKIGNQAIDPKESPKGSPTLELQLVEGKVYGYGGCNRFGGDVKLENGQLVFGPLMSTEMACANSDVEARYLKLLTGQKITYVLDGEHLYLGEGENKMTFSKAKIDNTIKRGK
ncbi:META domain-containing protein [Chitinophaga horti]|uniref:META domain-containing protein n=1 Tax=Chitinophaga horti TaxID=2920382 RepID=A0ABY6J764_9BACT|nr:META domain-containing protein [Chitinophaga horti]UYQ94112.1 META domain-containing protein [Chitinophaga horti]